MKKQVNIAAVLLASMLFSPALSRADGMAFKGGDFSALAPVTEDEQVAVIVHRNGVQKMILAINFQAEKDEKALWILPLPGTPGQTRVDVLEAFPRFLGRDPLGNARRRLNETFALIACSQLYPAIPMALMPTLAGVKQSSGSVLVHEEVDKHGIHVEVITADSLEALTAYLQKKEVNLQPDQLKTFGPYLSKKYTLILAWISSLQELQEAFPDYKKESAFSLGRRPCLYVEFPTEKAFFPLRPTSAYGKEMVPVRLYVMDYVEPETSPALKELLKVSYFVQRKWYDDTAPKRFIADLPAKNIPYTYISVNTAAENFTDDLWFMPTTPKSIWYAGQIEALGEKGALAFALVLIALFSYVSAGLAGLWLFGRWKEFALFGLWNLLTLYGLSIALRRAGGERGEKLRALAKNWHGQPVPRASLFLARFALIFICLTVIVWQLLRLPLG